MPVVYLASAVYSVFVVYPVAVYFVFVVYLVSVVRRTVAVWRWVGFEQRWAGFEQLWAGRRRMLKVMEWAWGGRWTQSWVILLAEGQQRVWLYSMQTSHLDR